jgi:hypothetical protein
MLNEQPLPKKYKVNFPHFGERTVEVLSKDEHTATISWMDRSAPKEGEKGPGQFAHYTCQVPLSWLKE